MSDSFKLGARGLGLRPLAAGPLHDPPTVQIVGEPLGTGGPDATFTWSYEQAQGDPQEWFRVTIEDGSSNTVYDSGLLAGSNSSWTIDWDAEEIPGNGTYTVEIQVIGAGWSAFDSSSFSMSYGDPQLTILAPSDGAVHTDPTSVQVQWSLVDAGHTQEQYRVRLLGAETGLELYSTGWVTSTETTVNVPYTFVDNTEVVVEAQVKNNDGMRSS